ncbi:SCP2 sterol-binding domain-containing protein [Massilia sp. G4R7]|uniref:Ubiquinone biosynthesis accessory factor UbiJ n=1 Tax=Massilia phyllostachyos TaxID=2898585 RepID=A0ABS8Q7Y5_9BURK|nr:SCP2 sterol-binding domain-containing protein [Massilia phyllostachyos]MCD2517081.1 SCP2 sterol-binding domain-containing protein [Massilia phyllostachyos]
MFSSKALLATPAVATINHLLAQEAWARDALKRHAGKEACIDTGHLQLRLRVARDGMLEAGSGQGPANVTIRMKLTDLPLIAANRERAMSYVKIEGDAEFANAISALSKDLRWDAEHDLERVVGPLGARRIAEGGRSLAGGVLNGGRRLAENVAEFLLEEQPVLVRPAQVQGFAADVVRLRDDVERASKRIAKLEQRLAQSAPAATVILTPDN